jgi:hypothetical protein
MTVAYRTNSIKIPKTTTIHVYIYRYTHNIQYTNNIPKRKKEKQFTYSKTVKPAGKEMPSAWFLCVCVFVSVNV